MPIKLAYKWYWVWQALTPACMQSCVHRGIAKCHLSAAGHRRLCSKQQQHASSITLRRRCRESPRQLCDLEHGCQHEFAASWISWQPCYRGCEAPATSAWLHHFSTHWELVLQQPASAVVHRRDCSPRGLQCAGCACGTAACTCLLGLEECQH